VPIDRLPRQRGSHLAAVTAGFLVWLGLTGTSAAAAETEPVWCHRVRAGETLRAVAARYRSSVTALGRLNGISPSAALRAGRILALPTLSRLRAGALTLAGSPLVARPGNLERENHWANRTGLSRMRNARTVTWFVRRGLLVPIPPESGTVWVDGVPGPLRVARPWTRRFIKQLGAAAHSLFGARLKITGLTRTRAAQRALGRWNTNAAPAVGARQSSHLTGAAVDLSKRPHTDREIVWLRTVLTRLRRQRLVHAIEEFVQPHFHVFVLPSYAGYARRLPSPVLIGGC